MTCLNCSSEATGSYCFNCGQKTSTTRFSFKQIFKSDIANQYYSFFKSEIFFTIKELFSRPGHSVREYLLGKRVSHMNYMSLYVLLSGVGIFLDKYFNVDINAVSTNNKAVKEFLNNYFSFLRENPKTLIFITIPIVSFFTFILFKKSKFNFPEHLIMNVYKASGLLIISKIATVFSIFFSNIEFLALVLQIVNYATFGYSLWFIYQFFYDSKLYSIPSVLFRTFASVFLGLLFSTIIMFLYWLLYYATQVSHTL